MKRSFFKNCFMPMIALLPFGAVASEQVEVITPQDIEDNNYSLNLEPNHSIILDFSSTQVIINHKTIQDTVGKSLVIDDSSSIEIKFHEEKDTLDFISLDGLSVTVSLEDISGAPPNGVGPVKNEYRTSN